MLISQQASTATSSLSGNGYCWHGPFSYEACCGQFGGNEECFDEVFSYFRCCLSLDGWKLDELSLTSSLLLAPALELDWNDLDCSGREPWDELATSLKSMAGLRFNSDAPSVYVRNLISSVVRLPYFGLHDCPLGVIASLICLMIMQRGQDVVYQALSNATWHVVHQVSADFAKLASSRWPIFQQLVMLERSTVGFVWCADVAALRFIAIPKTGGTSVEMYGKRHGYQAWGSFHTCPLQHCSADLWEYNPDQTFCIVRNPYDRVLSAALWRGVKTPSELNDWVQNTVGMAWKNRDKEDNVVLPSHAYVVSTYGELKCKHVLHTERLSLEFCEFIGSRCPEFDRAACREEMQHLPNNVNLLQHLSVTDFSDSSMSVINDIFQIDFQLFSYTKFNQSKYLGNLRPFPLPASSRGWRDDGSGLRINHYGGAEVIY